jgi:hypothetical protein
MAGDEQKLRSPWEVRLYEQSTHRELGREPLSSPEQFKEGLSRLLAKNPSVGAFIAEIHVRATKIPTTVSERERQIAELEAYVNEEMAYGLSPSDFALYQQHRLDVPDNDARRRIHHELDQLILQALVEQGFRMLLVPVVLQRVNDWVTVEPEREALHHVRQLTKAIVQIARLAQGESKAPLDSWVRYEHPLLTETKALKKCLKEKVKGSHKLPDDYSLLDLMQEIVEGAPQTFPTFTRIEIPLQFVQAKPEMLRLLVEGKITPSVFRYELIGWSTNRDPESARQALSRLSRS